MRTSQLVLRGALFAAMLPFTTAASCDGGYRADTGNCPDEEACSDATPDGLHFKGAIIGEGFFDPGDIKPTALGGTQDVRIERESSDGVRSPFLVPHDVDVDNANIRIESSVDNLFTLRGMASGDTQLRVVDPSTGELFDRVRATVVPIASITTEMSVNVAILDPSDDTSENLYAPGATGYIRLVGASSYSLVDTSTQISGAGITQSGWDHFVVGNLAVGTHTLTISAGAGTAVTVPFEVAIPDNIAGGPDEITQGQKFFTCFAARRGTTPVHSLFDEITATGATVAPTAFAGCVTLTSTVADSVTIHVRTAGLAQDFVVHSYRADSARTTEPDHDAIGTAGDRAVIKSNAVAASR